ncbi:hypothetical protein P2C08_18760 [Xanthomonas perforans]|uniref:Uncharacterized protein n=1 Tax=Xanthomonas euvesicatoria TaxID=456327 RepID=A0AAX4FN66_XANEU|nr:MULTISPECIES: hypothetical protein [Xanthomonas]WOP48966.1 hypothetical protein R2B60_04320 [Xanthomonas euvesicatoria]WOP51723.1 hypothetical protein R5576_16915 [Xanthomonas euvesicatoria]WOP57432.1 hypothetical protein R5577_04510 [Xanthomonas euvesicatoria]
MTSTTPVRDGIYSAIILESERLPAKDPKPPQYMNAEELSNYIKKQIQDSYVDGAASLVQASLLPTEQAALAEKARWSQMAAQNAESAAFVSLP